MSNGANSVENRADLLRWSGVAGVEAALEDAPDVAIAPSLRGLEAGMIERAGLARPLALVADPRTHDALGARVAAALSPEEIVILEAPHADLETGEALARRIDGVGGLISCGAGVITDLGKWAASALGVPQAAFATALSMNGYLSATASLRVDGLKRSFVVEPPRTALFDLEISAAAPLRLARAGLADVLCRQTAETDQLLAHHLTGRPYDEDAFALQRRAETALVARAGDLEARRPEAILALARHVILSGYAMTLAGSSAPCSQGEHLIAHLLDMSHGEAWDALHGETIALTTPIMARLQERLLANERPPERAPAPIDRDDLAQLFGAGAKDAEIALQAKAEIAPISESAWRDAKSAVAAIARPANELARLTQQARIDVAPKTLERCVRYARALRERWTALDLAAETGALDGFLSAP